MQSTQWDSGIANAFSAKNILPKTSRSPYQRDGEEPTAELDFPQRRVLGRWRSCAYPIRLRVGQHAGGYALDVGVGAHGAHMRPAVVRVVERDLRRALSPAAG